MKFKPGDKVRFLNQTGGGIVARIISQQLVSVAIEDGFEIPTMTSELLKIDSDETSARFFERGDSSRTIKTETQPSRKQPEYIPEPENKIFTLRVDKLKPDNGIYLAFNPSDQKWLITGDVSICLLNPTAYEVIFSLNLKHPTSGWVGSDYDVIPAESGITIGQASREELENWQEGVVQMLFQKEKQNRLLPPVHASYKLKTSRFLKEDNYLSPVFYHQRMILVKLAETLPGDTDPHTQEGKDIAAINRRNTLIEKNEALIDRHRIAPDEAEVDLHISALSDDYGHLSKHEVLKMQIDYFRRSLDSALMHQYRKIIYIHGIGNGVLRDAILQILHDYEDLQVRTAPFQRYGYGAIEVLNPNPQ